MKIYFELRKDHVDKNENCPLTLNYIHKGKRLRLNTEVSIPENYYRIINKCVSQKVIDPSLNGKTINGKVFDVKDLTQKLENCETKLKSIIEGWKKKDERGQGEYPDPKYVSELYKNKQVKGIEKPMIVHLVEFIYGKWDPIIKKYVGGKIDHKKDMRRWNTIIGDVLEIRGYKIDFRKYKNEKSLTHWRDVIDNILQQKDNKLIDFYLKDVDKHFLNTYKYILLNRKYGKKDESVGLEERVGLENTTIRKRIKTFKEFLRKMVDEDHKVNMDFDKYILKEELEKDLDIETNIHILRFDEYTKLLELPLTDKPKLDYVRDLFCITMGTGLRFSDVIRIEPNMVKRNGETILTITTKKTGTEVVIPIKENIDRILQKHNDDMKTISNDKGNEYLKEVLGLLKMKSLDEYDEDKRKSGTETITYRKGTRKDFITFHSGRKFFICNCMVSGVPLNLIMGYTGHKGDWDVFKRYVDKNYGKGNGIKLPF